MKNVLSCFLASGLLCGLVAAQDRPVTVSLIELIANPGKVDGKLITVRGFLHFQHEKDIVIATFLNLYEEDAKNVLGNGVPVTPSASMLGNQEKLDNMYVTLTGVFHAVKVAGEGSLETGSIGGVRDCTVWSNPSRPVGLRKFGDIHDK